MPKRKKIDEKTLLKMIDGGTPQAEIIKKFKFANSTQLKLAYTNALMNSGKVKKIAGGQKAAAKKSGPKPIVVNKRGSLIVSKDQVEGMGFKIGDAFAVRKSAAGVSLKKV
jgi:aldehyde:ferredoxin oxidoreductase